MKIYLLVILALLSLNTFAQKKKQVQNTEKCKMVYDKEIGREVYVNTDTSPTFANDSTDESFWLSDNFQIGPLSKVYSQDQRVKFAYVIEKDGHSSFAKLFYPDDKEIEAEVKRIVALIPLYKPAICGNEAVVSTGNITMKLYKRKKE